METITCGSSLDRLREHMNHWYADWDWQAHEICLCAIVAHFAEPHTQALWPFLVGAPRTGKTELIHTLDGLPFTESLGDITPKAFMSGQGEKGLLASLDKHGKCVLLFKDFTTILSKRDDELIEVLATLREIADGAMNRWTGVGQVPVWKGKLTVIAAVTPAIYKAWRTMQTLGPRFLFVRWPSPDPLRAAKAAQTQIGHELEIHQAAQALVREIFDRASWGVPASMPTNYNDAVKYLASLTVRLRQHVSWNTGYTKIIDVSPLEGPSAIMKHLDLVIRARAALYGRESVNPDDFALAQRLADNSIPESRRLIFNALAAVPDALTSAQVRSATGLTLRTMHRELDELSELEIIESDLVDGIRWVELSPAYRDTIQLTHISP